MPRLTAGAWLRRTLVLSIFALSVALPAGAQASIGSVLLDSGATPANQDATVRGGVALTSTVDVLDGAPPAREPVKEIVLHFDNDFAFDTTGLAQCSASSVSTQHTAGAIAACPGAQVGSGHATFTSTSTTIPATVTAFNGVPSSGQPTVLLHLDVGSGLILTVSGTIGPSSLGGDFGSQIDFTPFPNTPGIQLSHLDLTFSNLEPSPGHHYLSARCADSDHLWQYWVDVTDWHSPTPTTVSGSEKQICTVGADSPPAAGGGGDGGSGQAAAASTATGQRAAALKRCKKKHGQARANCKKRANNLPL
jgi:hypothetical protein